MSSNDVPASALGESIWLEANRYYDAERAYYAVTVQEFMRRANPGHNLPNGMSQSSLASEIAYARQKIQNFLKASDSVPETSACAVLHRLERIEKEQNAMKQKIETLTSQMSGVQCQLSLISIPPMQQTNIQNKDITQIKENEANTNIQNGSSAADDDDIDLFGSDEDNEDDLKLREERVQAYANKKAKKPALVAKSSVVLDVKPWDDETDMKAVETAVRAIGTDGLVWGASKLVPLAYGISKLQIVAIVEDDKVSVDWLQETISEIEELVQSVDIAAFNKL